MANAVDKSTGQVVQVPDDQLIDKWKAGEVDLVDGHHYQVQLQNGTYGTVPAEHMGDAAEAGARVVSPAEAQSARLQRLYGGAAGAVTAGDTEMLSQFTGGLADQALLGAARHLESAGLRPKGYAGQFEQELQAPREMHPVATTVGGGIGALALAAALPGGGLAGAGERGALAATEGLGESALGNVARRGIVQGVRGSLEGLQQGVAQAVSDDAFANHQETAEHVVSTVGASSLWGGALGAAFGALGGGYGSLRGAVGSEGRNVLESALSHGGASDEDAAAIVGRTLGVEPAPGVGEKVRSYYVKAAAAVAKKSPEDIEWLLQNRAAVRDALEHAEETRNAASRDIRASLDELLPANRALTDEARGALKRGYIRRALGEQPYSLDLNPDAGLTEAEQAKSPLDIGREVERDARGRFKRGTGVRIKPDMVEGADVAAPPIEITQPRAQAMAAKARDMADHALSELYDMRDQPRIFGNPQAIPHAIEVVEEYSKKLDAAIGDNDVAEQFGLIDDIKKAVGKYTKGASRLSPAMATDELVAQQIRARASKYQTLYETLRSGLEDESVWGRAASDQQRINGAWTQQIDASDRFHRALTTEIGRDPENPWMTVRGADPAKVDAYVKGLLDPSKDLTHKAAVDYVQSTSRLADAIQEAYEIPAEKAAEVARIKKAAAAFDATLTRTKGNLSLVNQFEAMRAKTDGPGTAFATVAGIAAHGVSGGLAGLALGKIAGIFTHPAEAVLQLATIEKMARSSDGRIARALRGFGRGAAKPAAAIDSGTYARKAARVSEIMSRPEALAERIGANLGDLRTRAPRLADAMTATALSGLQFLHGKLPPAPAADPFEPKRRMPDPPPAVRETWLRYYAAVEDPHSVVEALRDGRIAPEGVEVLKGVYPSLYGRVQAQAFDMMAANKLSDLTKQQRIGLSLMLDIPIPEMSPAYIAARQAAYQQAGQAPDAAPPRSKPVNLTKHTPELAADRIESGAPQRA